MTIETIYYIAQTIAAIAILGTLYYGIRQIQMSADVSRANYMNTSMGGYMEFNLRLGDTPQKALVWQKGLRGDASLNEAERAQFDMLCYAAFYGYEGQFLMRQEGSAADLFVRGEDQVRYLVTLPGVTAWWKRARPNFRPDFAAHMDELMANSTHQVGTP
jgi:hypothetical protein